MIGRRSPYYPLVCYVIAIGIFNCLAFSIGFLVFVQWSILFIQAAILGQVLFGLLLGGLLSDYWLKGLVLGTSLLACWALCLLVGGGTRLSLILDYSYCWYLFALPAMILGVSTPLLICRFAFGWKLIRTNTPTGQVRFSVEDLMLTTAAIASVLVLCRVPQIATEARSINILTAIGIGIACFFSATLLILVSTVHMTFRSKSGRQRWLGYGLLFGLIYGGWIAFLFAMARPILAYSLAFPLGLFTPLLLGLRALRISGYELASRAARTESSPVKLGEQAAIASKRIKRRWALGVLAFAAISSTSLMVLDTFKLRSDKRNVGVRPRNVGVRPCFRFTRA